MTTAREAGFVPDLAKIHGLVGYEPKVQLDEIILRVIEDFRAR